MRTIIIIIISLLITQNNIKILSQSLDNDSTLSSIFSVNTYVCLNSEVKVVYTGNAGQNAEFFWEFNNAQVISGTNKGPYIIKWLESGIKEIKLYVKEDNKLSDTTKINVNVLEKSQTPQICLVTYDADKGKNIIVWERPTSQTIDHFNIYREALNNSMYDKIGEVLVEEISLFVDYTSDPENQSEKYKISSVDLCGDESELSNFHATMHLEISKAEGQGYQLSWTPYIGFQFNEYNIYRGKDANNLKFLTSVSSDVTKYIDNENSLMFYQVTVNKEVSCIARSLKKSSAEPYGKSVSNIEDNSLLFDDINYYKNVNNIRIYPNPSSDLLNIELDLTVNPQKIQILLFTPLGNKVYNNNLDFKSKSVNYLLDLKTLNVMKGLYILKIKIDDQTIYNKVFIE